MKFKISPKIQALLKKKNQGIKLDIGGGGSPQPGFVNIDMLTLPEVDILWNLEQFPWPLPDESVSQAQSSHLIEHLSPTAPDPRLSALFDLLLKKKILSKKEIADYIGETRPGPIFLRFMDEVWRILKVGGTFHFRCPYAGSQGDFWDPTHINHVNEVTMEYFDPLGPRTYNKVANWSFWHFYKPKPWKIEPGTPIWTPDGNLECVMRKRAFREDGKYVN